MRKITREIVRAFESRTPHRIDNSRTDGDSLWLFNNKIAAWGIDGLWITNAGWQSNTTKERLNGLTGVHIQQVNGTWYLNGRAWDGSWVNVYNFTHEISSTPEPEQVADEPEFDLTSEWMDAGYSRPVYSIYHTLAQENLEQVETMLNEAAIPSRRMESDTAGTYRPNYFVVVRPEDVVRASSILCESYSLL